MTNQLRSFVSAHWVSLTALIVFGGLSLQLTNEVLDLQPGESKRPMLVMCLVVLFFILMCTHVLIWCAARKVTMERLKRELDEARRQAYDRGIEKARSERAQDLDASLRAGITIGAQMPPLHRVMWFRLFATAPGYMTTKHAPAGYPIKEGASDVS